MWSNERLGLTAGQSRVSRVGPGLTQRWLRPSYSGGQTILVTASVHLAMPSLYCFWGEEYLLRPDWGERTFNICLLTETSANYCEEKEIMWSLWRDVNPLIIMSEENSCCGFKRKTVCMSLIGEEYIFLK